MAESLGAYKTLLICGTVSMFAVLIDSMMQTNQMLTATMEALKAGADKSREERQTTASEVKMIASGLKANEDSNRRREQTLVDMLIEMRGLRNDQRSQKR